MDLTHALSPALEPVLRQRCAWCAVKHETDGLGPILESDLVSDGLCDVAAAKWNAEMDAREAALVTR